MSVNKYIDIDSTYRDRREYPEIGDFVMEVNSAKQNGNNAFNAIDPVALSFPYDTGQLGAASAIVTLFGINFLQIQLGAAARNQINFYVGSYINFPYLASPDNNNFFLIVNYDNTTKICYCLNWNLTSVSGAFPPPAIGSDYLIYFQLANNFSPSLPLGNYVDTTGVSASTTQITLGPLASSVNDIYKGMYLFLPPTTTSIFPYILNNPQYSYQWYLITAYNGATKVATLRAPTLAIPPLGTRYMILPFSYDNYRSLQYYGTEIFNNPRCVNISLTNLTIPAFLPLSNSGGGYITNYPFVWVSLYSEKGITYQQPIISAAPATREALFKCCLTNTQPTRYFNLGPVISSQSVSFRINDTLRFKLLLPNGEAVKFNPSIYTFITGSFTYFTSLPFPLPPDPETQVQATFNITFTT